MVSELMEMPSMGLVSIPSLSITNCVTVKLTDRNYVLWKTQFESFLSGQLLLGFVTGENPAPSRTISVPGINKMLVEKQNPDFVTWSQIDQVIKAWILGSLSEDLLSHVIQCTTSQSVWDTLAAQFTRVSSSRLFELQRKLQTLSKGEKSMTDYLKEVKSLCDQLNAVGYCVDEKMKIFAALHGLGREYEPIKTSVEGSLDRFPAPSFESLVPKLIGYDDRLKAYDSNNSVSPHIAFNVTQTDNRTQPQYQNSNRGRNYNRYSRGRGSYSTRGRGFHQQISTNSPGQYSSSSGTSGTVLCQICGKPGHPALRCWHRFNNSYHDEDLPSALAAMRITDITDASGHEWVPDSGASAHITNNHQVLQQSQPYQGQDTVMLADGNFLPITHTGSASIASTSGVKEASGSGKLQ